MCSRGHHPAIGAAQLLIAVERARRVKGQPQAACLIKRFGQLRRIAQSEIETLAGQRVNNMRRLTDKAQFFIDIMFGQRQGEGLHGARRARAQAAGLAARRFVELIGQ